MENKNNKVESEFTGIDRLSTINRTIDNLNSQGWKVIDLRILDTEVTIKVENEYESKFKATVVLDLTDLREVKGKVITTIED